MGIAIAGAVALGIGAASGWLASDWLTAKNPSCKFSCDGGDS
jgi:hypothetical protein